MSCYLNDEEILATLENSDIEFLSDDENNNLNPDFLDDTSVIEGGFYDIFIHL